MRTIPIVLLLAACLFVALPVYATSSVTLPGATLLTTFDDSLMSDCGGLYTTKPKKVCGWSIFVWLVSPGHIEYSINADDIDIADECGSIDAMTTPEIFAAIATSTVTRGVALGLTPCPASGSAQTAVHFASCVERDGAGSSTTFTSCSSALNRVEFSFTCSSVTATGCSGGGECEVGCEGTWEGVEIE
jgi:hypothetical protein